MWVSVYKAIHMKMHFDLIVIGTGAGGATLVHSLAATGKKILLLERGEFLKREQDNWSVEAVFCKNKYQTKEVWYDKDGYQFTPGEHYFVGGNTKFYGAALFRLRKEDFGEIKHYGGVSPAWPLGYEDFEPYYTQAEKLYHVHGQRCVDPTDPQASSDYAFPPVSHEPAIQELNDNLKKAGLNPSPLPLGILLDEKDGKVSRFSPCIRCSAFDGFPCIVNGKADAHIICIEPALKFPNVTLMTNTLVTRLETDVTGSVITKVHAEQNGEPVSFSADIVVVACGAINSAALLLRSANNKHQRGLANGSDQVGRNYMRHNNSVLMAVSKTPNPTVFQKTLAINDFYFGADDSPYPLGSIQMLGKTSGLMLKAEAPGFASMMPEWPFDKITQHSFDFWVASEDLPDPNNQVTVRHDGHICLNLTVNNMEAHERLVKKLKSVLNQLGCFHHFFSHPFYLDKNIGIGGTAHQCGTIKFGTDPRTSVLDLNCKAHELDNLYVVDGGFFVSIGAVNPTLTIIANALRVAEHLKERLKG